MNTIFSSNLISYLPKPHLMNIELTSKYEQTTDITSCFCFIEDKDGKILVFEHSTDNSRKIDIPGGHIDEGENPLDCIIREVIEETGFSINNIKCLGIKHIELFGDKPINYKYPWPKSNMIFFKAKLGTKISEELFEDSAGISFLTKDELKIKLNIENSCFLKYI